MSIVISNAFKVIDGRPVTSSRIVAEYFGKQHHHVVRDIRSLIAQKPSLEASANFGEWSEEVEIGSGAKRTVKTFWIDRKGFCILAMGFTGAKALEFKCAFYDEFERMEAQLRESRNPALACDTITPTEQHAIQVAVAKRARRTASNYQTIYRAIKNRYQIARYDQLPRSQFQDCLVFIDEVDLSVPESNPAVREPDNEIRKGMYLSDAQANTLRNFVYCINYLFRDDFQMIYKLMCQFESPKRAHFYEVFNNFTAMMLENTLAQAGYSVTELDCYKYWATKNA